MSAVELKDSVVNQQAAPAAPKAPKAKDRVELQTLDAQELQTFEPKTPEEIQAYIGALRGRLAHGTDTVFYDKVKRDLWVAGKKVPSGRGTMPGTGYQSKKGLPQKPKDDEPKTRTLTNKELVEITDDMAERHQKDELAMLPGSIFRVLSVIKGTGVLFSGQNELGGGTKGLMRAQIMGKNPVLL